MLEGLEISILKLSEIKEDNQHFRIDSDYFKKEYLNFFIKVKDTKPLSTFVKSGYRVVYENTQIVDHEQAIEKKYPIFIQATDLQTPFIRTNNLFYVHNNDWERYPMGRIKHGELLIEVKGKAEKIAIVPDDFPEKSLVTGSLYKMSINEDLINKHYILVYLLTKYGKAFKERSKTNLLISFVSKDDLYKIPVPEFSVTFYSLIEKLIRNVYKNDNLSQDYYKTTEFDFLGKLLPTNWRPNNKNIAVKKLSSSFSITGRLDAEYYQPKYDELIKIISKISHKPLSDIVTFNKSIEPGSDAYQEEGIPFIRIADVSKYEISTPEIHLDRSLFDIDELKPKKDTILLSKDGSVGIAYKVEEDQDIITSSALLHLKLKTKEVLPDYLTLVLNSKLTQMQAERDAGGSIIQHWRPDEIKQVLIPILPMDVQKELSKQIQQSFKLRKESKHLLEVAKKAVEFAIEEGEAKAMKYIKENS